MQRFHSHESRNDCIAVRILLSNSGRGLKTDAELLRGILEEYGCHVEVCITPAWSERKTVWSHKYARLKSLLPSLCSRFLDSLQVNILGLTKSRTQLQIHLESIAVEYLACSKVNWLIPNQEWMRTQHLCFLRYITSVLCKTKEAQLAIQPYHQDASLVGFSNPLLNKLPTVGECKNRMRQFLHVAGTNRKKGTRSVVAAWRKHPEWPRLNVVIDNTSAIEPLPHNVKVWQRPDDATLTHLRLQCGIVVAPSEVEGYGHIFVEAMAFNQLVLATDAAPMNEVVQAQRGYLIPWQKKQICHLGMRYFVSIKAIEDTVTDVLKAPVDMLLQKARNGRYWSIKNHHAFVSEITDRIDKLRGYELFASALNKPSFTKH
ncbi:glycosyltransferase [Alteromonas sediminis]|uniref:Glycosyltransferase n=1 Tax=Alteromonas sediminis TaxID=2259342 RepID=A0A3N5YQR5_9ALTE|nr:glycosyltransferase [Alteromonas sediminis]RPJ68581.1 glycosyltransferase [Alteromonas sediminis]